MRLKLMLAYAGANYSGWQIQEKPNPPPTVQGAVETALFTLLRQKTRVIGAGRTDAGVHALGQAAHCDVPERDWDWRRRLNAVMPPDIRVIAACRTPSTFHARKDALAKTYTYQFWQEPGFVAPLFGNQSWNSGPLDIEAMRNGIMLLRGEHDFASFQNSGTDVLSTVRQIIDISLEEIALPDYPGSLPLLRLKITGNGFLKQMVRNLAGFLAAVGRHKFEWDCLASILAARDRRALPAQTAPARGLFLASVNYGAKHDSSC